MPRSFELTKGGILRSPRIGILAVTLLALTPSAYSAGFSIFEQGSKATGMGGAFAATADDPSAMFYNVAGLAQQRKTSALVGATIITFQNQFEGAGPFPGEGVVENYNTHTFTPPNAYLVVPIGENMTFGLGQFTAFGLRTDWRDPNRFSGRYVSQDANLKTISVQPSLAIKMMDDRLAVGFGAEYRTSRISLERNNLAINPFTQRIADVAHVRLNSDWESGWGWNLGVLFKPAQDWTLGASYRSAMDIDYKGDATFTQILTGYPQFDQIIASRIPPNQNISTTIAFPDFLHLGIATTMVPNWQIEFDAVRMGWSRFEEIVVNFENVSTPDLVIPEDWSDAYSLRLGGNRQVTDTWDIRLGALWDNTPQPVAAVGPLLPDSDRAGISFGVGFQGEHFSLELSELFLIFADRNTLGQSSDLFDGEYHTLANLIGVNLGYSF